MTKEMTAKEQAIINLGEMLTHVDPDLLVGPWLYASKEAAAQRRNMDVVAAAHGQWVHDTRHCSFFNNGPEATARLQELESQFQEFMESTVPMYRERPDPSRVASHEVARFERKLEQAMKKNGIQFPFMAELEQLRLGK